jgi:amidase
METYLNTEPWIKEDYLLPIPWRQVTLPPKLKFAIMWSGCIFTPHPPIIRAMKEVANYLSKAGIELVDWKPKSHDECWEIASGLSYEDGGKYIENLILSGGGVITVNEMDY